MTDDQFNGDPFLDWLFSDRIGNRITFAVAALCAILLIDMFMGLI